MPGSRAYTDTVYTRTSTENLVKNYDDPGAKTEELNKSVSFSYFSSLRSVQVVRGFIKEWETTPSRERERQETRI